MSEKKSLSKQGILFLFNDWEQSGLLERVPEDDKKNRKLLADYLSETMDYILDNDISIYNNPLHKETNYHIFLDIDTYIFPLIARIFGALYDDKSVRPQSLLTKIIVKDIVDDLHYQMSQIMKNYKSIADYFLKKYGEVYNYIDYEAQFVRELMEKWVKKIMTYR